MVATPADLRSAITVTGGKVVVTPATLESDAVTAVIAAFGTGGSLTIEGATITSKPDDDFVVVAGQVTVVGVMLSGSTRFYLDGTTAHLDLPGSPPPGWTLATSFPDLKASAIGPHALGTPVLRLHSQQIGDAAPGLTLTAGFDLPAPLEAIRWFADPGTGASISGPIVLDAGLPVSTLTVTPTIHAQLGSLAAIDLAMQYRTQTYRSDKNAKPVVGAASLLTGNLGFAHGGTPVQVPFQASFGEQTGVLNLQLATDSVFDVAFSEISGWLGGTDLTSGLPDVYRPNAGITLHDVNFAIGLRSKSLESVTLGFQSTEDWTIVGDLVIRAPVTLEFMVMPGRTPSLSTSIHGTIQLAEGFALDVYAQYPDFLIRGDLPDGEPVDLQPLITYLGGVTEGVPSDLQIDVLSFEAHPAGHFYSFDIDVIGEWQIVKALSVTQLRAALRYDNAVLDLLFEGRFLVGGVDFLLSAEYYSEDGSSGWLFSGDAGNQSPILIGKFVQNLIGDFSSTAAQALPDFIATLEIAHLGVTFDTGTSDFTFRCEAQWQIDTTPLDLTLHIDLRKQGDGYTHLYSGALVIGPLRFELVFEDIKDGDTASSLLLAAMQPEGKVDVKALVAGVSADAGALMPQLSLGLENALFLYRSRTGQPSTYLFGLALALDFDLSGLPLVGSVLQQNGIGGIKDIQALYASADIGADDVTLFNGLLTEAQAKPPLPTKKGATGTTPVLHKGFNFAANLDLRGSALALTAGGNTAPPGTPAPAPGPVAPARPPSGNASWFDVKKSIGPVTLDRIGVRYEGGRAWLLLDADFALASLTLGLDGLAIGTRLEDLTDIAVNLDGMSLEFQSGPLSIGGGFLRVGGDYLGEAHVRAGQFGLSAIGGYAPAEQSFFIFARLQVPLGGPPYFFVTGLAGGFGVNRDLILPPIDRLTSFPMLPANSQFPPSLGDDPGTTLAATLAQVADEIPVRPGVNWAAAGLDFTSFEMVDASAVVAVTFGVEFAVALIGVCRITVPKLDPEPIVYLEIALEAQFKPAQGLLAVDGRITPASFLFAKLVRITGGFAFYLWFAGEHEGDFVVSVGGYHPRFTKPDHYPVVPRLQIVYQIGALIIKGQTYLALTPHMLMAGLRIDATWETGALKAWFSAGIDFLLGWRPFHYEADAYVHIGVSLTVDLWFTSVSVTVHVGVDLGIWGPPFGGKAVIDLDIVSFTIHFGDAQRREVVDWHKFVTSFLPAGEDKGAAAPARLAAAALADPLAPAPASSVLCTASVSDGLVRELRARDASEFFSWIVDSNHFELRSNSLIPAKQASFNAFALQQPFTVAGGFTAPAGVTPPSARYDTAAYPQGVCWTKQFGVLPMGKSDAQFDTGHKVQLKRAPEGTDYTQIASYTDAIDDLAITPLVKPAASALWAPSDPGLNGARLVDDTLVGLALSPVVEHPDVTLQADLWAMLFDQNQRIDWSSSPPAPDRQDSYGAVADNVARTLTLSFAGAPVTLSDYRLTILADAGAAAARSALVGALDDLGFGFDPAAINVADMAHYPLWDWPMIRTLGEEVAA